MADDDTDLHPEGEHLVEDLAEDILDMICAVPAFSMLPWSKVHQALDPARHQVLLGQADGLPTKSWPLPVPRAGG